MAAHPLALRFEGIFGQEITSLDCHVGCVGKEVRCNLALGKVEDYFVDRIPFTKLDLVIHLDCLAPHIYACSHGRAIVPEVFKMVGDILDRTFHKLRVIHHRGYADFLHETVPTVAFPCLPVVYIQKRIPAEDEIGVCLLLEIRLYFIDVEFVVVDYFNIVPGKAIFPVLQDTGRAAGNGGKQRQPS